MRRFLFFLSLAALAATMLAGCGGLQEPVVLDREATEKVVAMQATSFGFEPNNLRAFAGDTLVFRIQSLSDMGHNFTITTPDGGIMEDVDLPANKMTEVRVELPVSGTYRFYCAKPLHGTLGMAGQVVVIDRP